MRERTLISVSLKLRHRNNAFQRISEAVFRESVSIVINDPELARTLFRTVYCSIEVY